MIERGQSRANNQDDRARLNSTRALLAEFDQLIEGLGFSGKDRSEILAARELALRAHFRQADRLDGQPYINHPLAVAVTLIRSLGVTDMSSIQAALLHDCVEDQAATVIQLLRGTVGSAGDNQYLAHQRISWAFGRRVGEMVRNLTNPDFRDQAIRAQMKGDSRSGREIEDELYKDHVVHMMERDPAAFLVKLADFYQNAFGLTAVRCPAIQSKLRQKYGPVIPALLEKLSHIPESGHPLSRVKESVSYELRRGYARHFASAPQAA